LVIVLIADQNDCYFCLWVDAPVDFFNVGLAAISSILLDLLFRNFDEER
jgi:hypothetical protein